mmetsp:Transcript_5998/g.9799  ORF Transcript_5998/g.9799 Transcript_5998/m.9799 type:complete len:227 (+) Transcript_5998:60-740(+)
MIGDGDKVKSKVVVREEEGKVVMIFFCFVFFLKGEGNVKQKKEKKRRTRSVLIVVDRLWGITCKSVSHGDVMSGLDGGLLLAVVLQVTADEVTGSERRHQRELSSQHSSAHNTTQLTSIASWGLDICSSNTKQIQAGTLSREVSSTTDSSDLDRRHGSRDVEITVGLSLHLDDTVAALDVLGRVLTSGDVNGGDDVGGVGVEASNRTGHGGSDEVLVDVEVDERVD